MNHYFLIAISFLLIAFGQPAFVGAFGLVGACCGFALFWHALLDIQSWKRKLTIATLWFAAVQCVQLSWALSHPFYYIYAVLLIYSLLFGLQFGITTLFVSKTNLNYLWFAPVLAAIWTLMEWSRLFIFTGIAWNPVGLLLSGSLYSLQGASIAGAYGLSFLVILTNGILLQTFVMKRNYSIWATLLIAPYLFGWTHLAYHEEGLREAPNLKTLLVQTNFPSTDAIRFTSSQHAIAHAFQDWQTIFQLVQPHIEEAVDLVALPEIVVPWGTYWPIYHHEVVTAGWQEFFGNRSLPDPKRGLTMATDTGGWMVTNAYLAQALANLFHADTVVGFSDEEETNHGTVEGYNAAFVFSPTLPWQSRYEKRLPVPMGEYIPFEWCRNLAKRYGVCGSVTPGREAKVIIGSKARFGLSICYEEICGNIMRENRLKGADLLVNITNDGWFPHSRLPQQHFDHARLRAVEMGIPLVRACNTGITGACDSLGHVLGALSEESGQGTLLVDVPLFSYFTLYTLWGDWFILSLSGALTGLYGAFWCVRLQQKR